jgi:hypothetical protein
MRVMCDVLLFFFYYALYLSTFAFVLWVVLRNLCT